MQPEEGRALRVAQAASGTREMTYIGFRNTPSQSKIYAQLNAVGDYQVRKEGDNLLVLELKNTTIPLRNNKNHLDTTFFDSPIKMITPTEIEDASPTVRIVIELKDAAAFTEAVEGREVVLTFKK